MSAATPTVAATEPRANAVPGRVDERLELTYLRARAEPPWERPHRDGVDITDRPDLQTRIKAIGALSMSREWRGIESGGSFRTLTSKAHRAPTGH